MSVKTTRRREGLSRGIYILPNLCTTASLFCGFYSVVKALSGEPIAAAWAILLAGIFDLLDGRVARLTNAESEFGIEYDSLVDLAAFGLAPGILIYTWSLYGLKKLGWLAAFLYFACGAMRLARYNLQHNTVEERKFQGLPIPVAAYVLATYIIFYHYFNPIPPEGSWLVMGMTLGLSLLMVSNIGYRSFKQFDFRRKNSFFVLVLLVLALFVVAAKPEATMFILVLGYVAGGIVEELYRMKKKGPLSERMRHRKEERLRKKLRVIGGSDVEAENH